MSRRPRPSRAEVAAFVNSLEAWAQEQVDAWRHPVGTRVRVTLDDGSEVDTFTRSRAMVLPGGVPVVFCDGLRGVVMLDSLTAQEAH